MSVRMAVITSLAAALSVVATPSGPGMGSGAVLPSVNERSGVRWYRNLQYIEGQSADPVAHRLDLYLPDDGAWMQGRPLVVWIHGGGWVIGDKDDAFGVYGRLCRHLAERGIAAANVNYRLSPTVVHPAHVEDIAAAIAWLAGHADDFGFDSSHVFTSGHSAGGHLCTLVAVDDRYLAKHGLAVRDIIAGVIPSSGVYDLGGSFRTAFGAGDALDASPINHLDSNVPPFLLFVEEYGAFMRNQTARMRTALQNAAVENEIVVLHGTHHLTMLADLLHADGLHLRKMVEFVRNHSASPNE